VDADRVIGHPPGKLLSSPEALMAASPGAAAR